MMVEQARVVEYKDGLALVQCYVKSSCGGCAVESTCGSKALSTLAGEKIVPFFTLSVAQPLQAGDIIQIGITGNMLLKSIFLIYAIPLFVLVTTAVGFSQFFINELVVLLGMIFSTGITFWAVKQWINKGGQYANFSPIFLGKILGDYNGKDMV